VLYISNFKFLGRRQDDILVAVSTPQIKGKGKVPVLFFKLSITLWRHIGGVEVQLHTFFDLSTKWI